ncbi:hypothetical protein J6590_012848 [Homalodisca vitripennis]|nr:hypothetical protein J6590_012848 [Homalodisca vitripennis]
MLAAGSLANFRLNNKLCYSFATLPFTAISVDLRECYGTNTQQTFDVLVIDSAGLLSQKLCGNVKPSREVAWWHTKTAVKEISKHMASRLRLGH